MIEANKRSARKHKMVVETRANGDDEMMNSKVTGDSAAGIVRAM